MALTGMDEKQYRWFLRQAIIHSKVEPGEPVAFWNFVIPLVIGIALSFLASLLAPKPKVPEQRQLDVNQVQGQNLVNGARYTPKSGFDSVQNVVELGSVVPLVYANRQRIDGVSYGGVRVNTNLIWSQLLSIGGGQLLRAVFLVGEAEITDLDAEQFALGNNLINGYDLTSDFGRLTIYSSPDGGRLQSADRIAGALAANDIGNAQNSGGGDVFQVRGVGNSYTTDFCFTSTPSNQTTFGLYGFIGSNFPFRINPIFRPGVIAETRSDGELNCASDRQQLAERNKQNYVFPGRAGVEGASDSYVSVGVGDSITVRIYSSSDVERKFNSGDDGEATCTDVGQGVSSRQRSNDEQLNIGDIYRIGSALGICIDRSNDAFVSDADNDPVGGGVSTFATFQVLRAGSYHQWTAATLQDDGGFNATQRSHVLQSAEAIFSTERQGRVVEVGIRSNSQINISGLCNFGDARGYRRIDFDACDKDDGKDVEDADLTNFTSGQFSTFETRYSFFRISYRVAGSDDAYTDVNQLFGIRSTTGVAVYNYIRFEFPTVSRWEIRMTPVSGWEVRNNVATGDLLVLDPHINDSIKSASSGGLTLRYTGEPVARSEDTFSIKSLTSKEDKVTGTSIQQAGLGYNNGTYDVIMRATSGPGRGVEAEITVTGQGTIPNPDYDPTDPESPPTIPDPAGGSVTGFNMTYGGSQFSVGDVLRIDNPQDVPGLIASGGVTQQFLVNVTATAKRDLGTGFDDGEFYVDAWARLAESFIYNEVTATTDQPEHQVVYINTITANPSVPNYDNMAIVGMNIRSSKEIRSLDQFSVYVNRGINATSNFPEVLFDLMTNDRYGTGQVLSPAQIDQDSFTAATAFTSGRRYFFDGAISERINIRSWGAEVASNFLLDLMVRNGRFALEPVANFDGSEQVTQLFTSGNVLEDSFSLSFADDQDRIPPRISVIWREERETSGTINRGLFPVSREVTVRENGTPEDAPLEKIDLSDYCTSQRHAIDRAKWECLSRRLFTHTVTFKTVPTEAAIDIGSVFKMGMETVSYDQPQNGAIAADGTVTSWPELDDGTYDVLLWDGKTSVIQEASIVVSNGKSSPFNSVFCLRTAVSQTQTYKTQSLSFDEDGNIDVVGTFFPTVANGQAAIVALFPDANFVIEGT